MDPAVAQAKIADMHLGIAAIAFALDTLVVVDWDAIREDCFQALHILATSTHLPPDYDRKASEKAIRANITRIDATRTYLHALQAAGR